MKVCVLSLVALSVSLSSQATEVEQTDWSGGAGIPGPVLEWGASFDSAQGVSWLAVPGQLALASTPRSSCRKNYVDSNFDAAMSVCARDIDTDGDLDVVASAFFGDAVAWWRNEGGTPLQWSKHMIDDSFDGPCEIFAADLDLDGDGDVLGSAYEGDEIAWWRNEGGDPPVWTKFVISDAFDGAHEVCAADMDDDGDIDVMGAAAEGDLVVLWRNDGGDPVQWSTHIIDDAFDYGCRLAISDVDADGVKDVVGAAWNAQEIAWWRRDSVASDTWAKQLIATGFTGIHGLATDDMDRDGDIDVIGAAMDLGDIRMWRNDGGDPASWSEQLICGNFTGAGYVVAGDVDGDGDPDIAGSAWSNAGLAWWENVDGMAFTRHQAAGSLGQTSSVALADVDSDGDLDLLGTGFEDDLVAWWEITDFVSDGELTSSVLDAGSDTFASISWGSIEPEGTTVELRVRGGGDPTSLTSWSAPLANPGGLPSTGWRYLQYRVSLASADSTVSPIVTSVRLSSNPVSADPEGAVAPRLHSLCSPNPAHRSTTIRFTMSAEGRVKLRLFDVAGRHVKDVLDDYYTAGEYEVSIELPGPGTYLCRVEAGSETFGERIVTLQ